MNPYPHLTLAGRLAATVVLIAIHGTTAYNVVQIKRVLKDQQKRRHSNGNRESRLGADGPLRMVQ